MGKPRREEIKLGKDLKEEGIKKGEKKEKNLLIRFMNGLKMIYKRKDEEK